MVTRSRYRIEGKYIYFIDTKDTETIHINKRHINTGKRATPRDCVAARSACTKSNVLDAIFLHKTNFILYRNHKNHEGQPVYVRRRHSKALSIQITNFDKGNKFNPGAYILWPFKSTPKKSGPSGPRDPNGVGRRVIYRGMRGNPLNIEDQS